MLRVSGKALFFAVTVFLIISNCSIIVSSQDYEKLFDQWLLKYPRDYVSNHLQKQLRLQIFVQNLLKINKLDLTINGLNKFSDFTENQFKRLLGRLPSQQVKSSPAKRQSSLRSASRIPKKFDWRDYNVVTSVKDQGTCGNCWAFSTTAFFQSELIRRKQASKDIDLAQQFFFQCDTISQGCDGGYLDTAMDLGLSSGIPYEAQFPSNFDRQYRGVCSASISVEIQDSQRITIISGLNDQTMIKYLLQRPLNIGVSAKDWQNYAPSLSSRVFRCPSSLSNYDALDHTVLLVGFTETQWILKNQWGLDWGVNGYIYISRDENSNCGIGWQMNTLDFKLNDVLQTIRANSTANNQSSGLNGSANNSITVTPQSSNTTNIRVEIPVTLNCGLTNCQRCQFNSRDCAACKVGYQLNTNTKGCESQKVPNCIQFSSQAGFYRCVVCKSTFQLKEGACIIPSRTPAVIETTKVTIIQPLPPTAQSAPSNCLIAQCASCYTNNGKVECFSCMQGFSTNQENGQCQAININNCNLFMKIGAQTYQCFQCKKGFKLTGANTCVRK